VLPCQLLPAASRSRSCMFWWAFSAVMARLGTTRERLDCGVLVSPDLLALRQTCTTPRFRSSRSQVSLRSSPGRRPRVIATTKSAARRWDGIESHESSMAKGAIKIRNRTASWAAEALLSEVSLAVIARPTSRRKVARAWEESPPHRYSTGGLLANRAGQSRVESAARSLTYGRLDSQGCPRMVSSVHELFVAVTCGRYASVVM